MDAKVGSEGGDKPGVEPTPAPPARARRPYVRPRIESGEAFERVELSSHLPCNEGVFDGCTDPC